MTASRFYLAAGAASGLILILLGAFGAHGLQGTIGSELMSVYKKAVDYQAIHTLLLLIIGQQLQSWEREKWLVWAGGLAIAGILLFSGSLYLLAVTGYRPLGIVTPFGGTAFVLAWACLLKSVLKRK
jgi:uncharacterized membrane protein YgdD (TMEM256/DUF423 family)